MFRRICQCWGSGGVWCWWKISYWTSKSHVGIQIFYCSWQDSCHKVCISDVGKMKWLPPKTSLSSHEEVFAHWTEASRELLSGLRQPVFRLKRRRHVETEVKVCNFKTVVAESHGTTNAKQNLSVNHKSSAIHVVKWTLKTGWSRPSGPQVFWHMTTAV